MNDSLTLKEVAVGQTTYMEANQEERKKVEVPQRKVLVESTRIQNEPLNGEIMHVVHRVAKDGTVVVRMNFEKQKKKDIYRKLNRKIGEG